MTTVATTDIEGRLDELTRQIEFLVAEAEERKRTKETYTDLVQDLTPIASQGMGTVTRVMEDAEEKGYLEFAKSGIGVVDRVVTSFSPEDVEALGDNVVLILETVKEMTQPELMQMMRSTLHEVSEADEDVNPPSLPKLAMQMREPEVRRGLARMIALLRSMGSVDPTDVKDRKEAGR